MFLVRVLKRWYRSFWMLGSLGFSGFVMELRFFRGWGALVSFLRRVFRLALFW